MNLRITPLGAAIVEVLPDQKKKRRIMRRFTSHAECPTSVIFSKFELEAFYAEQGKVVTGIATKTK